MSVLTIDEYQDKNPRISGMKLLHNALSQITTDLFSVTAPAVVDHKSFEYYQQHHELEEEDVKKIESVAKEMFAVSETGLLVVRRAYIVPGLAEPPGPRYLGLKDTQDVINAIKGIFDFAIEQGYYKEGESKIEAFFYPFVDPPKLTLPIPAHAILPRGGYAVARDMEANTVKILAVFGNNEGVQTLEGVDEYMVNTKDMIIVRKYIAQKKQALCTTERAASDKIDLPIDFQFSQVLNDLEILQIARMVVNCTTISGRPKRLEFSAGDKNIAFNEAIDHSIDKKIFDDYLYTGHVVSVKEPKDLKKIKPGSADQVVYISKSVVESRSYDLLNSVAAFQETLNVLYPGTTATAHAMRVLIDSGHRAFVAGNKEFQDGEEVTIQVVNGNTEILSNNVKIERNIIPLREGAEYSKEFVGGKGYNLAKLVEYGYTVPEGFIVKTTVFRDMNLFESPEFKDFFNQLSDDKLYVVRSSANIEDASDMSLAGEFETVLGVRKEDIQKAIVTVWESVDALHLKKILKDTEISAIKMAVVVQELVDSKISGVTFGANIQNRNTDQVLLEITEGFADTVVDGIAQVRRIVFDKLSGAILSDTNSIDIDKTIINALYRLYVRVEDLFGSIQDVEWTIDTKGQIYVLQSRDLKA